MHCREDTAASEEDEREKARLRQAEAMREAEVRKERKRRATERKAAQKVAASKAKEVQKSAAAAAAVVPEPKEDVSGLCLCALSVESIIVCLEDVKAISRPMSVDMPSQLALLPGEWAARASLDEELHAFSISKVVACGERATVASAFVDMYMIAHTRRLMCRSLKRRLSSLLPRMLL